MKLIDMHVHTTASDGVFTPIQVINYSLLKQLSGIAITDHDTVGGIDEAMRHAHNLKDFVVVPGIELSTDYCGEEIHILGYFINHKSEKLNEALENLKKARVVRAKKIVDLLNLKGIKISFEEIERISGVDVIGRPHIARILTNKGYSKSVPEAFKEFLVKGSKAYIPRDKIGVVEAIKLIKASHGKVVLAHPGLIKEKKLINKILEHDFDGIETYHPSHSIEDALNFESLAKKHNLICTAGSDFHQIPTEDDIHDDLGSCSLPLGRIEKWKKEFELINKKPN